MLVQDDVIRINSILEDLLDSKINVYEGIVNYERYTIYFLDRRSVTVKKISDNKFLVLDNSLDECDFCIFFT